MHIFGSHCSWRPGLIAGALRSCTTRTAAASPPKPRYTTPQRRRRRGHQRSSQGHAPRERLASRTASSTAARAASCISSQDDAARGGQSFRPPWAYDDADWTGARDKLLVALQRSEANDAVVDEERHPLRRPGVLLHGKRRHGQFRGDGRDVDRRLAKLRQRCGRGDCCTEESETRVRRRRVGLRFVWAVVLRPERRGFARA